MKTEDLIQLGALAAIGFLAYQKFGVARGNSPVNTTTPGLQPSQQRVVTTELDPDFGVTNPSAGWDDSSGGITFLQRAIDWAF